MMSNQTQPRAAVTAHTPGPWRVGDVGATVYGPPDGNPAPEVIARVCSDPVVIIPARKRANARLIAAAPDLLAALERITDQLERVGDSRKDAPFIEAARAAIAKATGPQ